MDNDGNPNTPAEHVAAELTETGRNLRALVAGSRSLYALGAADAYDEAADIVSKALTTEPETDFMDRGADGRCDECGVLQYDDSEPRLDIPEDYWQAHGPENEDNHVSDPRAFLHCSVTVCGVGFCCDAYAVCEGENGVQTAVWEWAEEEVFPAIWTAGRAEGGPFDTVTIKGREYVIVITPYG